MFNNQPLKKGLGMGQYFSDKSATILFDNNAWIFKTIMFVVQLNCNKIIKEVHKIWRWI
jgi:hypothetical protein